MIKVGILGATGYMGGEALRVLLEHPEVKVVWATAREKAEIGCFHPNLYGAEVKLIHPDKITPCDAVFLALPSGVSAEKAKELLASGHKVIDLGSDFRLKNQSPIQAPYGIPELHRAAIKKAKLVANPGCFSSAAILGLAPLAKAKLIDLEKIVIDGLSGTAGAGAEPDRSTHHPEIGSNILPYNVVGHRHTAEMEQELAELAGKPVSIHFTPAYVPIVRGILNICHAFPVKKITRAKLLELYRDFYKNEPFIKVYDLPKDPNVPWNYRPYPWVSAVAGTNYCHLGMDMDEKRGRIVVMSALDSMGKGGAHAGVQNLNLMFGLPEETGLKRRALHP